jgi:hypothetical protein
LVDLLLPSARQRRYDLSYSEEHSMEQALSAASPPPLQSYFTLSCDTSMIMRADR